MVPASRAHEEGALVMRSSLTKHRDMARSILPSRARSIPRQLAYVRRTARRGIARDLATLTRERRGDSNDWDDWDDWDEEGDLRAYPDIEIHQVVRWRRAADKLNHFERWAIEVTKELPPEDRLGHLRAILPGGLIGDHAMSHLESRVELNPHHWRNLDDVKVRFWEAHLARGRAERERLRSLLVALLEAPGGHKALNAAVKRIAAADGQPARTLTGVGDVDGFVAHVTVEQYGRLVDPRWRDAIEETARALGVAGQERPPRASRGAPRP
jgi:hypothetical protein